VQRKKRQEIPSGNHKLVLTVHAQNRHRTEDTCDFFIQLYLSPARNVLTTPDLTELNSTQLICAVSRIVSYEQGFGLCCQCVITRVQRIPTRDGKEPKISGSVRVLYRWNRRDVSGVVICYGLSVVVSTRKLIEDKGLKSC